MQKCAQTLKFCISGRNLNLIGDLDLRLEFAIGIWICDWNFQIPDLSFLPQNRNFPGANWKIGREIRHGRACRPASAEIRPASAGFGRNPPGFGRNPPGNFLTKIGKLLRNFPIFARFKVYELENSKYTV